ncbi:prepilin-type N-terminal cleavage/methylation domain-containing protein [Candidatus Kaiserbacteria bacterium]|nr:prepilin-type N-terminal cleavage/methylation domain-containing protein [Candidatus Kaiserbacteria bacterium]
MLSKFPQKNNGFTLVEMLVALSLFTIVVTIVAGSILVLISGNQQVVKEQSVMANMSFVMDSMTREIRTGKNYYCDSSFGSQPDANQNQDCVSGNKAISFVEAGNSITGSNNGRIAYYFDSTNKTIMRKVGNSSPQSIVSNDIYIKSAKFFVTGTKSLSDNSPDVNQPTVTIVITATESSVSGEKPITLQTTITQRELDL